MSGFFFNLRKVLSITEEIWPGFENMTGVCFVVEYFYRPINIHVRRTQNKALITYCFAKVWMIRLLNYMYTALPPALKKWYISVIKNAFAQFLVPLLLLYNTLQKKIRNNNNGESSWITLITKIQWSKEENIILFTYCLKYYIYSCPSISV